LQTSTKKLPIQYAPHAIPCAFPVQTLPQTAAVAKQYLAPITSCNHLACSVSQHAQLAFMATLQLSDACHAIRVAVRALGQPTDRALLVRLIAVKSRISWYLEQDLAQTYARTVFIQIRPLSDANCVMPAVQNVLTLPRIVPCVSRSLKAHWFTCKISHASKSAEQVSSNLVLHA
jgi:hypothetical protein